MATTVNNTTINTRLTILFDANVNPDSANDGPRTGTGNTESDVYIDNQVYLNIRSHTEVPSEIHALQWNASTNTGELEYTDNRDNEAVSSLPNWATNVVIRCEAQDKPTLLNNTQIILQTQILFMMIVQLTQRLTLQELPTFPTTALLFSETVYFRIKKIHSP